MLKFTLAAAVSAFGLAATAFAQSPSMPPDPSAPLSTPQYLAAAAQSDAFEIAEGNMARTMAKSPKVEQFGAEMVSAHKLTTGNLKAAAAAANITPASKPALRPDQLQMVAQLRDLSGAAFDQEYIRQQVMSHQQALAVQSNYAQNGDVPQLRAVAMQTVPIVQSHLQMAQNLQASMGGM